MNLPGLPGWPVKATARTAPRESVFADHLGLDAVVAYSDGALSLGAFQRAAAHVLRCASCAREVEEQSTARRQLRAAAEPAMPDHLMRSLLSIPVALPAVRPPNAQPRQRRR